MKESKVQEKVQSRWKQLLEVWGVSTRLGLTSFGGPIAHLGYFHDEYIRRRKWLDERSYADLVALCQFLPGPASSQVGIGIGVMRAGLLGGVVAWLGFTLPSVLALVLFAFLLQGLNVQEAGWIHGLKLVAVAIVAHAILGMGQKLATGKSRATIAILAAVMTLMWQSAWTQVAIILAAGIVGTYLFREKDSRETEVSSPIIPIGRSVAVACLVLFFALLFALPLLRQFSAAPWLAMFDSFYRAGSLVFGGGHVVLPMLEKEIVPTGWLGREDFLAGYGAAQAVPGPLFTFASYLGAVMGGWTGAILATIAVFLPGFLLVIGALPFWDYLRTRPGIQGALAGVNAAVVGILLAALYDPIWTSTVLDARDFALAGILFVMLAFWKAPPWVVVVAGAVGGIVIGL